MAEKSKKVKCDCGTVFKALHAWEELCPECAAVIEHDANVEMFGAGDAAYFEAAGLDGEIGNH